MLQEIYSSKHTFGAEVHKPNIRVNRWHSKYKILNDIERDNFCLNDLLTKSNRTTLQTYRVEERTFGTPCTVKPLLSGHLRDLPKFPLYNRGL